MSGPVRPLGPDEMTAPTAAQTAIIYAGVSNQDQARHGFSLEVQVEQCEQFCDRSGWHVAAVCIDPGVSATERDRPGLSKALAALIPPSP